MTFNEGDRVWPRDDVEQGASFEVGTVERVSQAGYVRVQWDDGSREWFGPKTNGLILVGGDDALPRHDWDVQPVLNVPIVDPPCRECGVIQNNENDRGPCRVRRMAK